MGDDDGKGRQDAVTAPYPRTPADDGAKTPRLAARMWSPGDLAASAVVTSPIDRPTTPIERVTTPIERPTDPLDRVTDPVDLMTAPVERRGLPLPPPDSPDSITGRAPLAPRRAPAATSHHGSTTIGSPLEALERDELLRTRRFCFIGAAIALAGAASVPLLPGDPTASALLLSCVGGALASILFLFLRTDDPVAFRKPTTLLGWFIPAACVMSVIPYFGVFSPAPMLLLLGVYFIGLGKNGPLAFAVYLTCAVAQGAIAVCVITRAFHDTGIVQIKPLAERDQWIVQALVQVVLASAYITARVSRRTALAAVSELEHAVRIAAHREALLLEAREELERALRSGRGRFTEQTIGGYQLGELIGRGAMGEVYAATNSGRAVAIKLLSQASLGNPNHVLRFLRELRTAANVVAPNIVRVIEVGEQPVPFLVMERLHGKTLSEMLRDQRSLAPDAVVQLVRQVGAGITAAADAGIVHRDLKPQNVFFHHGTTWKVLDFGVARAMDSGDTLTAGHVVGTPSYMAPEQASGATVDHGTDLYALAAVAYRALTGHPPYAGGDVAQTLYKVIHTQPRRPSELVELPSDVDLVLAIGLAKRRLDRFASAAELADALADALRGELPEEIVERGALLVRAGAWASHKSRVSTARMR